MGILPLDRIVDASSGLQQTELFREHLLFSVKAASSVLKRSTLMYSVLTLPSLNTRRWLSLVALSSRQIWYHWQIRCWSCSLWCADGMTHSRHVCFGSGSEEYLVSLVRPRLQCHLHCNTVCHTQARPASYALATGDHTLSSYWSTRGRAYTLHTAATRCWAFYQNAPVLDH